MPLSFKKTLTPHPVGQLQQVVLQKESYKRTGSCFFLSVICFISYSTETGHLVPVRIFFFISMPGIIWGEKSWCALLLSIPKPCVGLIRIKFPFQFFPSLRWYICYEPSRWKPLLLRNPDLPIVFTPCMFLVSWCLGDYLNMYEQIKKVCGSLVL